MISSEDRAFLEALIRQAGAELMKYWPGRGEGGVKPELDVTKKSDGSSVTAADFASNNIIVAGLQGRFKNSSIMSEEIPESHADSNRKMLWIIDPLDGTKAFIEGRDDFSILIGLAIEDRMRVGMMYFPARDLLAWAVHGDGSQIDGTVGQVSMSANFRQQSVYYRNCDPTPGPHLYSKTMDSGLAFLALARGDFDGIILRMTTHREWDIAAPMVVVQESGGRVTDEHGHPIEFKDGKISCKYVLASNTLLHDQLVAMVPK